MKTQLGERGKVSDDDDDVDEGRYRCKETGLQKSSIWR